jgi:hypothetical protein
MAFPVKGDPDKVVRYVDVQALPNTENLKDRLENSIFIVTGVDPRYLGRDTGSVQTTGGMDLQQQRIISMSDNLRINNLESFVENLTELIIDFYIEFGTEYRSVRRTQNGDAKDNGDADKINFKKIADNKFDYEMNAAPHLPKNKMRLADAATQLLQLQGQFQFQPPIITHQEWLMWQDFPQKDLIMQRIKGAMQQMDEEDLVADLLSFGGLIDKGMSPQDAIQTLVQERQMKRDNPTLANPGSTVGGGQGPLL